MSIAGKWGYDDGDHYTGEFDTAEAAATAYVDRNLPPVGDEFDVGQYRDPTPPWVYVSAEAVVDHILQQDEYSGEFAEDWPGSSKDQDKELEDALTLVFKEWCEKHGLMPRWGMVEAMRKCEATADGGFRFVDAA